MPSNTVEPKCPVFGECGGCQFQHLPYQEELRHKEEELRRIFELNLDVGPEVFDPIVPSPQEYHYRNRLDMKLLKTRSQETFMGFSPVGRYRVVEVDACPIAMEPISDFLPQLKKQAVERLPSKYRNANLVVRTGDDGRVCWGGIGRRSLKMPPEEYLSVEILGKKIFFSMDTFFQANTSILPALMEKIIGLDVCTPETRLFDLYGGVGLFGISFYDRVAEVVLIEENIHATRVAKFNAEHHQCRNFETVSGRVEDELPFRLKDDRPNVVMVDPPRAGLSPSVTKTLTQAPGIRTLIYLSCHPESLVRDLTQFGQAGWTIEKVIPFDFFPKTKHLETLVLMRSKV